MKKARRLVVGAVALAAAGSLFLSPAAHGAADPFGDDDPVVIDADGSDGSIGVYTGLPGQPLLGARVQNGTVCVGFSYQVPFCPVTIGLG